MVAWIQPDNSGCCQQDFLLSENEVSREYFEVHTYKDIFQDFREVRAQSLLKCNKIRMLFRNNVAPLLFADSNCAEMLPLQKRRRVIVRFALFSE